MCHAEISAPVSGGSGVEEREIEIQGVGRSIPASLSIPGEGDAWPSVVVFHDIWGANDFYRDLARRLALEGFMAMLPDFFIREGPLESQSREAAFARRERMDQLLAIKDLAGAITFMRNHPRSNGNVAVIGFCLGGTFAFLASARDPLPDAAVSYYGFPAGNPDWDLKPIDEADKIRAPILFHVGDQDTGVGMDNVECYTSAVQDASGSIETIIYPGAPHGFLTFDPESDQFATSQESWIKTLEFLAEQLAS